MQLPFKNGPAAASACCPRRLRKRRRIERLWGFVCLACLVVLLLGSDLRGDRQVAAATIPQGAKTAPVAHAAAEPTPVRVADAACAQCHGAIFAAYLKTTKANGSGVASEGLIPGSFQHAKSGAAYQVGVDHAGQGTDGPVLRYAVPAKSVEASERLLYFLGSGNLGRTYLYNVDGYMLESPVAYFSSLRGYAMAPGLAGVADVPPALPMNARCMRCHMSDVQEPMPGTGNHFAGLPFLHGGITCEQCHGDTAQHVASRGKTPLLKLMSLDPVRRDSVCISCHLEGDTSVELRGKSVLAYKPGDDVRQYLTYFVDPGNTGRSVTEVEQLSVSRCKRTSGDRMSCMSCHDPHSRPEAAERVAFYRGKCLQCHTGVQFAAEHHPENPDCTACHMPKSEVRDTPHVAWTDHRILRVSGKGATGVELRDELGNALGSAATGKTIQAVLPGSTVTERELGLGYYNLLMKGQAQWVREATRNLAAAAVKDPSDGAVANALASILQQEGKLNEAQRLYQQALRSGTTDFAAQSNLAMLYARAGDLRAAEDTWARLFQQAEDEEGLGLNLAVADCMEGKAAEATATLRTVLRFSPASTRARDQLRRTADGGCSAR